MSLVTFMFYFFECVTAVAAISLVFIRNVFYGALLLIVCLLSLAGIYILTFAEFVAITQILIYAGGVLVVIIFGVMLTAKISGKPLVVQHGNVLGGVLVSGAFFMLLTWLITTQTFREQEPAIATSDSAMINAIGIGLMTDFILPFEVAGILLLVALIGAAIIASTIKSKKV
ncbi:NADH-quinone oxidoreductase subunit J [Ohtaekwangia sp.]|uniref:NADH-quinone oxidoreductase subunit J family protein n=1 Tax=Ohtaekwangia sp. TaxID=2066019 RepID=UPI002F93B1E1